MLIQFGKLCEDCRNGCSTEQLECERAEILCCGCSGKGCRHCNHRGQVELPRCPKQYVGRDVSEALFYADLWKKGMPPNAGGVLDQMNWLVEASAFIWSEQADLKAEAFALPED